MAKDIDSMLDDVQDDGKTVLLDEAQTETVEETTEKKATEEVAEKPPEKQETKSYLSEKDEKKDEKRDRFVPVATIQKERQKRQAAEKALEELKAKLQSKETVDDDDLKSLISDPDELVDGNTVLKIIDKTSKKVADSVRQSIAQEQAERDAEVQAKERESQLEQSEAEARKKFSDFDAVVSAAVDNNLFTADEMDSICRSKNPGAILYRKSKEILSIMGIQPSVKTKEETPASPETDDDNDIYSEVFKEK